MTQEELLLALAKARESEKEGRTIDVKEASSSLRESVIYEVILTEEANIDIENDVSYLPVELRNPQAAKALLNDFDVTVESVPENAGSLPL